jgi:hypothetical protein
MHFLALLLTLGFALVARASTRFGPHFSMGINAPQQQLPSFVYITRMKTTLILGELPLPRSASLVIWPGLITSSDHGWDIVQSVAASMAHKSFGSDCGDAQDTWCLFSYTLSCHWGGSDCTSVSTPKGTAVPPGSAVDFECS